MKEWKPRGAAGTGFISLVLMQLSSPIRRYCYCISFVYGQRFLTSRPLSAHPVGYLPVTAFPTGLYSLWSASSASEMVLSGWLILGLGLVVLVHGTVLLTDLADRLGTASGPLMIGYAAIVLLNQALLASGLAGVFDPTGCLRGHPSPGPSRGGTRRHPGGRRRDGASRRRSRLPAGSRPRGT